jgi:hypothetical protein
MWVKKTDEEYQKDRSKAFWAGFIGFPLVITFLVVLFEKIGFSRFSEILYYFGSGGYPGYGRPAMSWSDILAELPFVIGFLILISGFCAYFAGKSSGVLVCPKCDKLKTASDQEFCTCGEAFVNTQRLDWVEDNKEIVR